MKKTVTKILNIVVTVLIVLVLIASAFVLIATLTSKEENGGVPNLFGKAPINVLSDSMKGDGELNFNKGDLLICDVVPIEKRIGSEYKKGDVITFPYDIDSDGFNDYITHRIIEVNENGTYTTKGDNNDTYDQDPHGTTVMPAVSGSSIIAVYRGAKIPGLGNFIDLLRSQTGFFFIILLPMIIFFVYEAIRVIINVMAYTKEKALAKAQETIANADLTEEQKQRAIEEYLAAQRANEQPAQTAPEAVESPEEKTDAPGE